MQSPVGRLTLVASDSGLAAILWENDNPRRVPVNLVAEDPDHPVLIETEKQLREYFAGQIGKPAAVRAVGAANGRNPISIIAPCHRVLGSTGNLTGFAGGLQAKAHLLALEGAANATR